MDGCGIAAALHRAAQLRAATNTERMENMAEVKCRERQKQIPDRLQERNEKARGGLDPYRKGFPARTGPVHVTLAASGQP